MSPGRAVWIAGLAAVLVFLPSLGNGFALDDVGDIRENPVIQQAEDPLDVLASPYRGQVPAARSPWRPLTSLTFWLNEVAADDAPLLYHATNVGLHATVTVLVTLTMLTLKLTPGPALAGSLLFAVHPVHVEAVANVVGRGDALMAFFSLTGVLLFLSDRLPTFARAAGVALVYALALGSKESGVALPGLLAVLAVYRLTRSGPPGSDESHDRTWRTEAIVLAPTVLVLAVYLWMRLQVLGVWVHSDTAPYITVLSGSERFTTAVANLTHTARLLLVPLDLVADYGPDVITPVGAASARFLVGLAIGVAAVALAVRLRHDAPLVTVGIAWVVVTAFIVSNLALPIGVWIAERTLYLPSVGVCLAVAAALAHALRGPDPGRRTAGALIALAVVLGAWRTVDRIPAWADTDAVFRTLAEEQPESFRSQWWLARSMTDVGDPAGGLEWFDRAVETNPNDFRLRLDRVRALLLAGRPVDADRELDELPVADPTWFVYRVQSYLMQERLEDARAAVTDGRTRFPNDPRLIRQASELSNEPGGTP